MSFTHIQAPEPFDVDVVSSIFLAGPTPRDAATRSWRPEALAILERLGFDGVVFDPERSGVYDDYESQVGWEAACLARSDVVVFWVARELEVMPAFTTNVEFGALISSGRCVVGGPVDAPKNKYLVSTARRHGLVWHTSLEAVMEEAVTRARPSVPRTGVETKLPARVAAHSGVRSWLDAVEAQGSELVDVDVVCAYPSQADVFAAVLHPTIRPAGEDRVKGNEIVVARPDVGAVCARGPLRGGDTEVALVGEYRAATTHPSARVWELPAGSVPAGEDPRTGAAREFEEETSLHVDPERLTHVCSSQVAATLLTHTAHVYTVELTDDELDVVRNAGVQGVVADHAEVTYPVVVTYDEAATLVDLSTLGMIAASLRS